MQRIKRSTAFPGFTVQIGREPWSWWIAVTTLGIFLKRNAERPNSDLSFYVVVAGLGFRPLRGYWNRGFMSAEKKEAPTEADAPQAS